MPQPVTTSALGGSLRVPGQPDLPVLVLLRHVASEPDAVRLVLVIDDDTSCEWLLGRALLTDGGHQGEVVVSTRGADLRIAVGALATLALPLAGAVEFLCATYAAAPTGCGSAAVALAGA